jgi:hypothetical protein
MEGIDCISLHEAVCFVFKTYRAVTLTQIMENTVGDAEVDGPQMFLSACEPNTL